ncbi:hypothetical protein ASE02_01040 [Phenylobacterium sp. Root700]|nr:hypothetical protein ASE02_01040 [Phenylobacterium sp. Root700]
MAQPPQYIGVDELDPAFYASTRQAVAVEPGRHLNLVCLGQGAPTVLLESGFGDDSLAWRKVQARVGAFTRVCSYDRAGYGLSDAARRRSDADNAVADLALLLQKAPISGPIVLVGHSLGGLYATHFANLHPGRVAGLVLMDPVQPGDGPAYGTLRDGTRKAWAKSITESETCLAAAQEGDLTAARSPANCLEDPPGPDPAFHDELNRRWGKAKYIAANLSELRSLMTDANGDSLDSAQAGPKQRDFGALPMIVLVSDPPKPLSGRPRWDESKAIRLRLQREPAGQSSEGKFQLVAGSGHMIQDDAPEVVIEAIQSVVAAVRGSPRDH